MLGTEKMSLKTFWEAVEQRLTACSTDELRDILRVMAQETSPTGRQTFLQKLKPTQGTTLTAQQVIEQEELLADIDDFIQELKAAWANVEHWEEQHEWGDYYDDEDSLGPYEKFVKPLTNLFDRTEATFDHGNLSLARAAYGKLFAVLNLEDDYGRGVQASDLTGVDIDAASTRYLRTIYKLEPLQERSQAIFDHLQQLRSGLMTRQLMLEDLIRISPEPLLDRKQFLTDWIAFLRTRSGSDVDAWLREAVRLSQGTSGLETLAQTEGQTRPRAYLDWFTALEQEGKHQELLLAAQEALQTLPAQLPIRAAIADHLGMAATQLNETEVLRAGRWEAFLSKPTLSRLLDLWEVTPPGAKRTTLMQHTVQHIQSYLARPSRRMNNVGRGEDDLERPAIIDQSILAHACLLAEDFETAHQLAAAQKVLGWSSNSNPQGLVVPFFLVLLSGRAPDALTTNLAQLWAWALQTNLGIWLELREKKGSAFKRLERAYAELFAKASLSNDRQAEILSWSLDVAQQRVQTIVGGKHHKSYGKAAILTAACAETLRLRGDREVAGSLVNEVSQRFPRHRAFQAKLKTTTQKMKRDLP